MENLVDQLWDSSEALRQYIDDIGKMLQTIGRAEKSLFAFVFIYH